MLKKLFFHLPGSVIDDRGRGLTLDWIKRGVVPGLKGGGAPNLPVP